MYFYKQWTISMFFILLTLLCTDVQKYYQCCDYFRKTYNFILFCQEHKKVKHKITISLLRVLDKALTSQDLSFLKLHREIYFTSFLITSQKHKCAVVRSTPLKKFSTSVAVCVPQSEIVMSTPLNFWFKHMQQKNIHTSRPLFTLK